MGSPMCESDAIGDMPYMIKNNNPD